MANFTNMLDVDKILNDTKLVIEYGDGLYLTHPLKDIYNFLFTVYPGFRCDYNYFTTAMHKYEYKTVYDLKRLKLPKEEMATLLKPSEDLLCATIKKTVNA